MNSADSNYLIRLRGRTRGPFSLSQLKQMSARGQFSRLHQISEDGTTWKPASELTTLFGTQAPTSQQRPSEEVAAVKKEIEWYYVLDQQQLGPVTEAELERHLRSKRILATALVWHQGLPDWTEAHEIFSAVIPPERSLVIPITFSVLVGIAALGAIGLGVWILQNQETSNLAHLLRPAGEIHAMDLANERTHQQVGAAIGMVVCYAEILQKTGERHERPFGHGTCFLVSPDGYAITNRHVVEDHQEWIDASAEGRVRKLISQNTIPDTIDPSILSPEARKEINNRIQELTPDLIGSISPQINVYFGGTPYRATIEYISRKYDMAVLKIDQPPAEKAYFALSDHSVPPQSTPVIALGFPGISQLAVTEDEAAVLASKSNANNLAELLFGKQDHRADFKTSAFEYVQTPGEVSVVQKEVGEIYHIQHTAPIRQGNSGGPLVFRSGPSVGTVIGINTLFLLHDAPVFIAFPVAQMRQELEKAIGPGKLSWR